jgi:hypothetical protein
MGTVENGWLPLILDKGKFLWAKQRRSLVSEEAGVNEGSLITTPGAFGPWDWGSIHQTNNLSQV